MQTKPANELVPGDVVARPRPNGTVRFHTVKHVMHDHLVGALRVRFTETHSCATLRPTCVVEVVA